MNLLDGIINPLNVLDQRIIPHIPPYFERVTLALSSEQMMGSIDNYDISYIRKVLRWLYQNTQGRIGIRLFSNELYMSRLEFEIGFEVPHEASFFILSFDSSGR
jgi:hypothetical protein